MMDNTKTLKLDSSFRPIEVIDAIEALVLCLIGKAQTIETYNEVINSVNKTFELPALLLSRELLNFATKQYHVIEKMLYGVMVINANTVLNILQLISSL